MLTSIEIGEYTANHQKPEPSSPPASPIVSINQKTESEFDKLDSINEEPQPYTLKRHSRPVSEHGMNDRNN